MRGNYYGIDMKITPDGKPYLIEVNGWNSGTKGFIDAYGDLRTQEKILTAMDDYTGGKQIYKRSGNIDAWKIAKIGMKSVLAPFSVPITWPLVKLLEHLGVRSVPHLHSQHHFYLNALKDLHWVLFKKQAVYDEHFDEAARKIGVDFVRFDKSYYHFTGDISIKTSEKGWKTLASDGGFYWSSGNPCSSEFNDQVANPYAISQLVNSKWYIHRMLEGTWLDEHLPITLLDGNAYRYPEKLEQLWDKTIVQKPHAGIQGEGIRLFSGDDLPSFWYPQRIMNDMAKVEVEGFRRSINFHHFWNSLSVLQEFIPSAPVKNRKTGYAHDSCIGTIVFDNGFIDGYHRLAPAPLEKSALTKRSSIANLANGASAQPLNDTELEIVANFSEKVVSTLENRIRKLNLHTILDFDAFEEKFWKQEFAKMKIKEATIPQ